MDVDSTLIEEEVIDLIAAHAGIETEVAAITAAAMRGEIDFREALRRRVGMLAGLPVSIFDTVANQTHFTKGALEVVSTAHQRGWKIGVVSGGFHEVVDTLVSRAGIDMALANRFEIVDGLLTGRLSGPIVDRDLKVATLRQWVASEGLTMSDAVAIGDGANDIPMIQAAGIGIAFCAKPIVREAADHVLDVRDLRKVFEIIDSYESKK